MAETFEKSLREAIMLREEFSNSVSDALEVANTSTDLRKLLNVTAKFSKICSDLQEDIANRLAGVIPSTSSVNQFPLQIAQSESVTETSREPALVEIPVVTQFKSPAFGVRLSNDFVAQKEKEKEKLEQLTKPESKIVPAGMSKAEKTEEENKDLTKIRIVPESSGGDFLQHIPCSRIFFPYLNPSTTEDSLRAGLMELGFEVVAAQLFRWSNRKSRGTAMVTLADSKQALDVVTRHDIEIDGWTVAPSMMLADVPDIMAAEPVAEIVKFRKADTPVIETDRVLPPDRVSNFGYQDEKSKEPLNTSFEQFLAKIQSQGQNKFD